MKNYWHVIKNSQENMNFYIKTFETLSSYWTKIAFNDLIQVKDK